MKTKELESLARFEAAKAVTEIANTLGITGDKIPSGSATAIRLILTNLYLIGWTDCQSVQLAERNGKEVIAKGPHGFVTL